jgi:hypothetical protein
MRVNVCKAQLPVGKVMIIFRFRFHRPGLCDFIFRPLQKHSEDLILLWSDTDMQLDIMVLPGDSGILQERPEML